MKKKTILSWITNVAFVAFLIITIVNPNVKATLISGLMKLGILNADVESHRVEDENKRMALPPGTSFVNLDGDELTLADLTGKAVFINFWATWCPPCIAEMPAINELHKKLKNDSDIVFLTVDTDNNLQKSTLFMQKKGYELPVYSIRGHLPEEVLSGTIPTTIILDKKGQVAFRKEGVADYNTASVTELIQELANRN